MSEEGKINDSLNEVPQDVANSPAPQKDKTKLLLYIIGGAAVFVLLLWLVIGRAQAYIKESEVEDVNEKLKQKDSAIKSFIKRITELNEELKNNNIEMEGMKYKNAHLHTAIKQRDEQIDELRGKVSQKEVEIDALKEVIQAKDETIESLNLKIEFLKTEVQDWYDQAQKIYSEMRYIVAITNQQLNLNQGLIREISSLESTVEEYSKRIGELIWENFGLKEKLYKAELDNSLNWISLNLIEKYQGIKINIKSVYKATSVNNCDSKDFYEKIKAERPNLFLATENSTNLIFGGFTANDWTSTTSGFKSDEFAFTFSASSKQTCELISSEKENAQYVSRTHDNKDILLGFGKHDIILGDKCLNEKTHFINPNKSYKCPTNTAKNFYTDEQNPALRSFEFFKVSIEPAE